MRADLALDYDEQVVTEALVPRAHSGSVDSLADGLGLAVEPEVAEALDVALGEADGLAVAVSPP